MNKFKSFFSSRKVKYGAMSVAITAAVITIIVILNSIISALGSKYNWYFDMTEKQVFSLSDEVKQLLDGVETDSQIEIIFAMPKDSAELNFSNLEKGGAIGYVQATAALLAERYDNITVSYHSSVKEPAFYWDNFPDMKEKDYVINQKSIIIAKKVADGGYSSDYYVKDVTSFYVFDDSTSKKSLYGYGGELTFAQAILNLSYNEKPTIYFTTGHSETVQSDGEFVKLASLFKAFDFDIKTIDTRLEEIPSNARMIIINNPKNDFAGEEIAKLQKYLNGVGTVMCFTDATATNLTNLYGFAETFGGVTVNAGKLVSDPNNRPAGGDLGSFIANVSSNSATDVYFQGKLQNSGALFKNAAYITIDERYSSDDGYDVGAVRITKPLLETSSTATVDGQKGVYSLMTVTSSSRREGVSYLVMCPCSEFSDDATYEHMDENNNFDMIKSMAKSMTSLQIAVDILPKAFISYKLNIKAAQANTLTVVFSLLIPAICAVAGAIVIIRRKRR